MILGGHLFAIFLWFSLLTFWLELVIAHYLSVFDRALRHELIHSLSQMSVLSDRAAELFLRCTGQNLCTTALELGIGQHPPSPQESPAVWQGARRKGDNNRWILIPPSLSILLASWGRDNRTSRFLASCRWEFMSGSHQECVRWESLETWPSSGKFILVALD